MTKAENAEVGQQEECQSCGTLLTCGLTKASDKFPAKKQWQVEGKAHYNYNFKTQEITCNGKVEDPKNTKIETQRQDVSAIIEKIAPSPEITESVNIVLQALNAANDRCHIIYPKLDVNSNEFGMIRNAFVTHILTVWTTLKKNK